MCVIVPSYGSKRSKIFITSNCLNKNKFKILCLRGHHAAARNAFLHHMNIFWTHLSWYFLILETRATDLWYPFIYFLFLLAAIATLRCDISRILSYIVCMYAHSVAVQHFIASKHDDMSKHRWKNVLYSWLMIRLYLITLRSSHSMVLLQVYRDIEVQKSQSK